MARRPSKHLRPVRPLSSAVATGEQTKRDGRWVVRTHHGADHPYRCPGCQQLIAPHRPHLVVWPHPDRLGGGVDERRHWHTACWNRRP